MDRESARADVRDLWKWVPPLSTADLLEAGWTVQDEFRLSWWDALVLVAAQLSDCATLLSEDFQHGHQFDTLRISSPFKATPKDDTQ